MITIATLLSCVELGLIYSLVVMPVWLSSTVIRFYDLSVEGSFCAGGAVTAVLLHIQMPAIVTIPAALLIGASIGLCTGLLHTLLGLNDLLSGIIVTTGLFSINLALASSNKSLAHMKTIFSYVEGLPYDLGNLILLLSVALSIFLLMRWLLATQVGLVIRASGENPALLRDLGKQQGFYTTLTLMICNASVALAGCLFVQYVGFFSIWTAVGILVVALTGLKIGQLFNEKLGIHVLVGAILYQALIALTFELMLPPEWNKLMTAVLMVVLMIISRIQRR